MRKKWLQLRVLLHGNASPHTMAVSLAYGLSAGIFPILGPVSVISLGVVWLFRLNLPVVLLLLYAVYPLQLALMLPFSWLGSLVMGSGEQGQYISLRSEVQWGTLSSVLRWAHEAVVGWLVLCLPLSVLAYRLSFRYISKQRQA
ncbi:MAG: DUF2062 domain-containing protein [Bacteroidia bacterium]